MKKENKTDEGTSKTAKEAKRKSTAVYWTISAREILKQSKSRSKAAFTQARHKLLQLLNGVYQAFDKCVKQESDRMNF